jgi:cytochrome c-type biogenesis protein CcmH/NrfF
MRSVGWWVVAFVLLGAAGASSARAQQPGRTNTKAAVHTTALEHEARQIETMLIAPCCWSEQVSRHHSEAAEQVKQEIRAMLAAGLTQQEVLDRFVGAYGIRILAEPPDAGFGRVLHHAPWMAGLVSAIGLGFIIRHVTRGRLRETQADQSGSAGLAVPAEPRPAAPLEDEYRQRLDDELRDLD